MIYGRPPETLISAEVYLRLVDGDVNRSGSAAAALGPRYSAPWYFSASDTQLLCCRALADEKSF